MRQEYSYGAIACTGAGDRLLYLLVHERSGHIGFPKGHIEPGETPLQCAAREVWEETGIRVKLDEGFAEQVSYQIAEHTCKHVCFYAATFAGQKLNPLPGEVRRALLLPYDEALEALTHEESRSMLRKAHRYFRTLSGMRETT